MTSGFILRLIFELLNFSHLLSFHLFVASATLCAIVPSPIFSSSYRCSLIRFNSPKSVASKILSFLANHSTQMLTRIVLDNGRMSADFLKKSIVHFKHLRYLLLADAVSMSDFVLWEVLGTLPSLEDLTLIAFDPASHPAHASENSKSQSGDSKYFRALESLSIAGSFFFIQHLLGFVDSPCLKSINQLG